MVCVVAGKIETEKCGAAEIPLFPSTSAPASRFLIKFPNWMIPNLPQIFVKHCSLANIYCHASGQFSFAIIFPLGCIPLKKQAGHDYWTNFSGNLLLSE